MFWDSMSGFLVFEMGLGRVLPKIDVKCMD
jgi:hypothetical protein